MPTVRQALWLLVLMATPTFLVFADETTPAAPAGGCCSAQAAPAAAAPAAACPAGAKSCPTDAAACPVAAAKAAQAPAACADCAAHTAAPATQPSTEKQNVPALLNFTVPDIDGKDVPLSRFQGKTLLIVNVASKCGNTPQYKPLQALYEKYKDQGLVVLAFPANEFKGQEPGDNAQIKAFCESRFGITFPLFSKIVVKGEGQHPLYQLLTSRDTNPQFAGDIRWNFEKFLIGRDGQIVGRFDPKTQPDDPKLVSAIEAQLAAKP